MWCSVLEIGGITHRSCEKWMSDETTTCGHCRGNGLVPYPDPVPQCGCGAPGTHPAMCLHRKSFFESERKATEREQVYVRALIAGLAKGKAAALVGAKPSELDTQASRKFLATTLDEAGLTDKKIAHKIRDKMDAKMFLKVRNSDGAEALEEVDDNAAQFKFTELATKIKGGIAEKGQFSVAGNITIINNHSRIVQDPMDDAIDVTPKGEQDEKVRIHESSER